MVRDGISERHVRIAGVLNVLLGGWLAAWPLLPEFPSHDGATHRCFLVIGLFLTVCGLGRIFWPRRLIGLSAANMAFGLWILLSPVTLGFLFNWPFAAESIATGLAIMSFAGWSVVESLDAQAAR
ncbi:MAG TPA: hypothetical protein VGM84_25575 [Steroidobacteraceae bacterium]|jgi:hypothetical protein